MLLEGLNTDQLVPRGSTDNRVNVRIQHQEATVTQRENDPTLFPPLLLNSLDSLLAYKQKILKEQYFPTKKIL